MNNSIVISQKSLMAELFYMFFWERVCFTPETNEVWIIVPHYDAGKFVLKLNPFEQIGGLDKAAYTLEFWKANEAELNAAEPFYYGRCFKRKMDELLKKVQPSQKVKFAPDGTPPGQIEGTY